MNRRPHPNEGSFENMMTKKNLKEMKKVTSSYLSMLSSEQFYVR